MSQSLQDFQKLVKQSSGAASLNNEILTMKPYNDWQALIEPIPFAVAILGQLMLDVSQGRDLILLDNEATKFRHIASNDTLKSACVKLSEKAFKAFKTANEKMGYIHSTCSPMFSHASAIMVSVRDEDENAAKVLIAASTMLKTSADNCVIATESVQQEFHEMMEFSAELQLVLTAASGNASELVKETELMQKIQQEQKLRMDNQVKRREEGLSKMETAYDDSVDKFQKAIDALPSASELLGYSIVTGIINGFETVVGIDRSSGREIDNEAGKPVRKPEDPKQDKDDGSYDWANEIHPPINILCQCVIAITGKGEGDQWKIVLDKALETRVWLEIVLESKSKGNSSAETQAASFCQRGLELCDMATKIARALNTDAMKEEFEKLKIELQQFNFEIAQIVAKGNANATGSNPINDVIVETPSIEAQESSGHALLEQYRFKVEAAKARAHMAQQDYQASAEKYLKDSQERADLMGKLVQAKFEVENKKDIVKVISVALVSIGKASAEWSKLVTFFQSIAANAKIAVGKSTKDYLAKAHLTREKIGNQSSHSFYRDIMLTQSREVVKSVYFMQQSAAMFLELSKSYIIDIVISLNSLLLTENSAELPAIQARMSTQCINAQKALINSIKERNAAYIVEVQKRQEELNMLARAIPVSGEKEKQIKDAVDSGFEEVRKRLGL